MGKGDEQTTTQVCIALGAGFAAVLGSRLLGIPKSYWELDEWLFRMGVVRFAPLEHHPHPPGYPLLIGLGKAVNLVVGDPFLALVTLATVSSILTYLALADAFHRISGDVWIGIAGALLYSLSPAMLVHSTTPMSDPPALLFLAIALAAGTRLGPWGVESSAPPGSSRDATFRARWRNRRDLVAPAIFGASLSASIGCRPQYAVALVPTLFAGALASRRWRARAAAIGAFTMTSAAWFVPLVVACAGWRSFLEYQAMQIQTVATHDALLSRGTRTWPSLVARFTADGWGPPWLSFPALAIAMAGLVIAVRERRRDAALLLVMASTYLAFTLLTTDPADAVRYGLPIQMASAFLFALGLARCARRSPWPASSTAAAVVALCTASWIYVWPVITPRRTTPSPPVQAAAWARENLGRRTVILPDPSLRPHIDLLLANFPFRMKPNEGVAKYWNRPDIAVYMIIEGASSVANAQTFSWPASDAYRRLTRNHYRVVSILPWAPARRYLPLTGVHEWERSADLGGWRWLDAEAHLRIPPGEGPLELVLLAPAYVPFFQTRVELLAGDDRITATTLDRGDHATLCLDFPAQGGVLTVRSAESFVPADVAGHDRRRLSLQLLDLRRVTPTESGAGEPAACIAARSAA